MFVVWPKKEKKKNKIIINIRKMLYVLRYLYKNTMLLYLYKFNNNKRMETRTKQMNATR